MASLECPYVDAVCVCGAETFSAESVVCTDCTALQGGCGDGVCEAYGENYWDCHLDFGPRCFSGDQRCHENDMQTCNEQGVWELVTCPTDAICRLSQYGLTCETTSEDGSHQDARCWGDSDSDGCGDIDGKTIAAGGSQAVPNNSCCPVGTHVEVSVAAGLQRVST
ncbi:MAG: hypothetical protein ACI9MR_002551 [Myxococcota bacterium]|jgi:hypothetical protein